MVTLVVSFCYTPAVRRIPSLISLAVHLNKKNFSYHFPDVFLFLCVCLYFLMACLRKQMWSDYRMSYLSVFRFLSFFFLKQHKEHKISHM